MEQKSNSKYAHSSEATRPFLLRSSFCQAKKQPPKHFTEPIFVVHQCFVGDSNLTKKFVIDNYQEKELVLVSDSHRKMEVLLIGQLGLPDFAERIKCFVVEIERIKGLKLKGENQDNG